jgi:type IV secretory pathway VirD2 relaxase
LPFACLFATPLDALRKPVDLPGGRFDAGRMSDDENEFEPRLGRMRDDGAGSQRAAGGAVRKVQRAVRSAGADRASRQASSTSRRRAGRCSRIGRGQQVATSLRQIAEAQRLAGHRSRRAIVKARIVRLKPGSGAVTAHLRYLVREGVTRDGQPGRFYGAEGEGLDAGAFLDRSQGDRHQFRLIVSAEDGDRLADLKAFTRGLMRQMEADLGTSLEWMAVDHFNTGHPHTHIVVRGRDDLGADLIIAEDYLTHGLRLRAQERLTLELGLEPEIELREKLQREVTAERLTRIDRAMLEEPQEGPMDLRPQAGQSRAEADRTLRLGRLKTLARLGLAEEVEPGVWTLASDLEARLKEMGERGDIIRAMHRVVTAQRLERSEAAFVIQRDAVTPVIGRLLDKQLLDDRDDRMGLVIDGVDGQVHHVEAGTVAADELAIGSVVEVSAGGATRAVDETVAELAQADGFYRPTRHLQALEEGRLRLAEEADAGNLVASHVRRLEALRRAGVVERFGQDLWSIPKDFLDRAQAYDQGRRGVAYVRQLSALSLDEQVRSDGATWLDRELISRERTKLADGGFGAEAAKALDARKDELVRQGHAWRRGSEVRARNNLIATLRMQELERLGAELVEERGQPFTRLRPGTEVRGRIAEKVELASGSYTVFDLGHSFALVPWRPVIERHLGREISALIEDGGGVSWRLGRERGLGR